MYTYVRCHVRVNTEWMAVNAAGMTLKELMDNYEKVRIYLDEGTTHYLIKLHMRYNGLTLQERLLTVTDYLIAIQGTIAQTPLDVVTLDKVGKLKTTELWDLPVDVGMGKTNNSPSNTLPLGADTDLMITPKAIPINNSILDYINDFCLIVLAGKIFIPNVNSGAAFVPNAREHLSNSVYKDYEISVLDFGEISKVTTIPLDINNTVVRPRTSVDIENYRTFMNVDIDASLTTLVGKSILLVIDGYPYFLDKTAFMYDAQTLILDIDHRQIARRKIANGDLVNAVEVNTMPIADFVLTDNTYLIILDNDDVNKRVSLAGRTDIPGLYTYPYLTDGVLIDELGGVVSYLIEGWDGLNLSLSVMNGKRTFFMDEYIDPARGLIIGKTTRAPRCYASQDLRFLELYTTKPYM